MTNPWIFTGALFGFLSVAFGAFGAHALKNILDPAQLQTFQTGVHYQMFHSLVLIIVGLMMRLSAGGMEFGSVKLLNTSGWAFTIGIILFSGSLYVLTLSGVRAFGAVTPLGGLSFLTGWGVFIYSSFVIMKG